MSYSIFFSLANVNATKTIIISNVHHLLLATEPLQQLCLGKLLEEGVGADPVDASDQLDPHGGQGSPAASNIQAKGVKQLENRLEFSKMGHKL